MSNQLTFFSSETSSEMELPYSESGVSAGFPSVAEDMMGLSLDLNKELVRNPASTFFARVSGVSMIDEGIDEGDLLVIDKSVEPSNNCLAVCFLDGEFTLKRVKFEKECAWLMPANEKYKPIKVTSDNEFSIWGVVKYLIKKI
ncbi:MAG: translesion error-prone DNA polymerase V autoproteolytic subunit [Bacteroidetes bacterium]|nr:translesion error-prone DNA polymerase V autoproteolytic subunit [Bacteroidota bacterium]